MGGDGGLGHHGLIEIDDSESSTTIVPQLFLGCLDALSYLLSLFLRWYLGYLDLLLTHPMLLVYIPQG